MKVVEFGKTNSDVIVLLHGGGLSWWNYRAEAELLKERYHVVLPILDGHADSDTPFTTIENTAKELIDYIDRFFHGAVFAIGGLSLGGQILVEALSQRRDICKFAIIESALVVPSPIMTALIAPTFGISYNLTQKKWFAKAQFRYLNIQDGLFEDYYRDTCKIRKQDMIRFLQSNQSYAVKPSLADTTAKATIVIGGKEQKAMRRSAEILHATIPDSSVQILDGYTHGEFGLNHPDAYAGLFVRFAMGV